MYSKKHEIESIIEDLIENTILETFADSFSNSQECEVALAVLIEKLEELDTTSFKPMFD
jgi:hypothetical protein